MNPREPLRIYGIACALTRRPVSVTPDFATAECFWTELNLFCRLGVRRERKATPARSCRVIHRDLDPLYWVDLPSAGTLLKSCCVRERNGTTAGRPSSERGDSDAPYPVGRAAVAQCGCARESFDTTAGHTQNRVKLVGLGLGDKLSKRTG
jgi:hypothetical protein